MINDEDEKTIQGILDEMNNWMNKNLDTDKEEIDSKKRNLKQQDIKPLLHRADGGKRYLVEYLNEIRDKYKGDKNDIGKHHYKERKIK